MRACAECGFDWDRDAALLTADIAPAADLELPAADRVRVRPQPNVWSPLEYTAHLREVLRFYDERIRRTLSEDRPQLAAFGFDEACDRLRYNDQAPAAVVTELHRHATDLVAVLDRLDDDQLARIAIGSEGDERTVLELARRAAHEVQHHSLDIARGLE